MLRRISLIACLAVCTAAHGIGPASLPSAGPVVGGTNADFLAAAAHFSTAYFNTQHTSTAGPSFVNAFTLNPAGQGVTLWFASQDAGYRNSLEVLTGFAPTTVFSDSHALVAGDHVALNGGAAVSAPLNFFAFSNVNASGNGASYFWTGFANTDGQTHLNMTQTAWSHAGSLWYALALDDQFVNKSGTSSDRDWNDLRVLVQIHPVATPEPATIAMLAGFMGIAVWLWRRQKTVLA